MASGDKFYIADKATLDEVKGKIGSTTDTGGSGTAGSVFGKLNYLVSQVSSYLSNIYNRIGSQSDTANNSTSSTTHAKLNWFLNLFGKTDDPEGTATTGTVMGKLNKLVDMSSNVNAKIVCKGLIGTKFTITHSNKYLEPFVVEITVGNSIHVAGEIYAVTSPVPLGNYNVAIELSGETTNSSVNVSTVGEFFTVPYAFYAPIQKFTANGTLTIPEDISKIFITAIGGGGAGGKGGGRYDETFGGGGGGGGDKGTLVIKKEYTVVPGSTHVITVGKGGSPYSSTQKGGTPTIIGTLLTVSGGSAGGDANKATRGTGYGSAGSGGEDKESGKSASDANGGSGGAMGDRVSENGIQHYPGGGGGGGGGGIDTNGEVTKDAKGGDGAKGGKNTGGYVYSGSDGIGYGSGGGGGGGVGSADTAATGSNGGSGRPGIVIIYTGINILA